MKGKIVKGISGFYYVHVAETGIYECKAKKAKISWKKVKRAAGYRVMYSTDKKFKKAAVKITTKKANYVTKKLKKGKKYFIKVAAYRKDKAGKKVYGSFSAVKKIKVK